MVAKAFVRVTTVATLASLVAACTPFAADEAENAPIAEAGADALPREDSGASDAFVDAAADTGTEPFDAGDSGPPGPIVFTGAVDRILFTGMVVTPDTAFDGEVLVEGASITCVGTGGVCGALWPLVRLTPSNTMTRHSIVRDRMGVNPFNS
jgi:hypothetical protein